MARRITNERGSLSIAIVSALNALRNKSKIIWLKLKSKSNDFACSSNCIPPNTSRSRPLSVEVDSPMSVEADSPVISEGDRVIATIDSSRWRPTKAELCIWICCSFYENLCIPIDDLVMYGMSLNMFEDVHDMVGARDRVYDLIEAMNETMQETLIKAWKDHSYMDDVITLGDKEYNSEYVIMPQCVYWAALVISERYSSVLRGNRGMRTWNETERYANCYVLSLVVKYISEHPVNWGFPKVGMLRLTYRKHSQSLPVDFFERMEELRVLILNVPSLSQSLIRLRNLQTLRLKLFKSADISAIGGLVNLKFLSISTFSLTDIPREMGQLGNLRLLDLRKMNFAYIPPGVLSKMLKLEELYLPLSFRMWGCKAKEVNADHDECNSRDQEDDHDKQRINASLSEVDDGEKINASFGEIASLSLNALQISVQEASILPKKSPVFNHILRFKILLQNNLTYQQFNEGSLNKLQLSGDTHDIKESGICELMSRTEVLNLTRVRNLKSVLCQLRDDDFPQLKKMIVTECDELEYVVDTTEKWVAFTSFYFYELNSLHLSMLSNLEEIWHGDGLRPHFRLFDNLRQINIRFCHKLKYVFPWSMFGGLRQLRSIEILDCNEMEGIFYRNDEDDTYVVYYIEELHLHSLPKLVGFLVQKDNIIDDRLRNVEATTDQSLTINEVSHISKKHTTSHMEI